MSEIYEIVECTKHVCPKCKNSFSHLLLPGEECYDMKKCLRKCDHCKHEVGHQFTLLEIK